MDTNFYDVIVCGAELAGLVAAALLARRGFRVLLLGHDADRASFDAGGFTLSRAPALLPPLESLPVARVLTELNCVQIIRRRAPVLSPGFQVAMPRHRFDVLAERDGARDRDADRSSARPDAGPPGGAPGLFRRELEREFPADVAAIEAALQRLSAVSQLLEPLLGSELTLPPDGFWERREVGRLESMLPKPGTDLLAPLPAGHPMRAVIGAPAALSTSFGPADLGAVSQARAFDQARRGLHRLEGGYAALHAFLLEKIETFSGERREKVIPTEIVFRRGRAAGIRVRPRDETIGCQHLIWAGPAAKLWPLCAEKPSRRGGRDGSGLRTACYRYGVSMLVAPDAIPEGMGNRIFLIGDPTRPPLEDNALCVTVGQPAPRDPGRVPVWAECLVPAPAVDAGSGYVRALRGRVRRQLGKLFPFFPDHLLVLASPFDGLPPEIPGAAATAPAVSPIPMPTVYSAEGPRILDLAGLPHATGIKNLFIAGRENLPGLGLEGELVSAWGVARLVAGSNPRRDAPRREVLLNES